MSNRLIKLLLWPRQKLDIVYYALKESSNLPDPSFMIEIANQLINPKCQVQQDQPSSISAYFRKERKLTESELFFVLSMLNLESVSNKNLAGIDLDKMFQCAFYKSETLPIAEQAIILLARLHPNQAIEHVTLDSHSKTVAFISGLLRNGESPAYIQDMFQQNEKYSDFVSIILNHAIKSNNEETIFNKQYASGSLSISPSLTKSSSCPVCLLQSNCSTHKGKLFDFESTLKTLQELKFFPSRLESAI